MDQLARMASHIGELRYFRCPYHANVIKILEADSSKTVFIFSDSWGIKGQTLNFQIIARPIIKCLSLLQK